MARGARFVFVLLIFALVVSSVESTVISSNCTESLLTSCEEQFNENTLPVCPEVLELQDCLSACANTKNKILNRPSQAVRLKYESLVNKMNSYPDCISASKVHKKQCSEENVNNCYQQFNQNATSICPEVKKLRMCISELAGCHAMKHPKFVLSIDILEKHRDCFFVNYSRILEVLKKKDDKKTDKPPQAFKTPKTGNTISVTSINITEKPPETRLELESGHLPYTFVVVATVCTLKLHIGVMMDKQSSEDINCSVPVNLEETQISALQLVEHHSGSRFQMRRLGKRALIHTKILLDAHQTCDQAHIGEYTCEWRSCKNDSFSFLPQLILVALPLMCIFQSKPHRRIVISLLTSINILRHHVLCLHSWWFCWGLKCTQASGGYNKRRSCEWLGEEEVKNLSPPPPQATRGLLACALQPNKTASYAGYINLLNCQPSPLSGLVKIDCKIDSH
ncbi:hypothetical protein ACROYT_G037004 [Oculina patagonica]